MFVDLVWWHISDTYWYTNKKPLKYHFERNIYVMGAEPDENTDTFSSFFLSFVKTEKVGSGSWEMDV